MIDIKQLSLALQPLVSRVRTDVTAIKRNGILSWTKEPLTEERFLQHLNGGHARGVCPIKEGGETTMVALLDLDSHKGEVSWQEMAQIAQKVAEEIKKHGLLPIHWRSSGGKGIHLYVIWNNPQDAFSVRKCLQDALAELGYHDGTGGVIKNEIEIFPKQDSVPVGGYGNQFILPLAGESVPLDPDLDLEPMNREDAVSVAWTPSSPVPVQVRPQPRTRQRHPFGYEPDLQRLRDMLNYISPDDYNTWIKIGMALHHETNGSDGGLEIFDEWSSRGTTYRDFEELQYKWQSFHDKKGKPVTGGTLTLLAREGGWKGPEAEPKVDNANPEFTADTEAPVLDAKDHSGVARQFLDTKFQTQDGTSLLRTNGLWYQHQGVCYQERTEEGIRADMRQYLDRARKRVNTGTAPFHPSMAQISGVMDALRGKTLKENIQAPYWLKGYESADPREFISLKSGIVHIPTRQRLPHSVNFFTVNSLPFSWEESGEPTEWLKFIEQVFPDDKESQDTLQEIFGYLLTPDTSQQKMFLFVGPKRSGKGTIARVMKGLLGPDNICGPSLTSLSGQFGLQPLIGRLVAIIPDARIGGLSDKQSIVEKLLMVSGEDSATVDRKHIESWTGVLSTRFVMMTNEIPQLGDASTALSSRFIVLQMKQSFYGREDHELSARLLKELPQILRWAMNGRDRLNERGYFVQPKTAKEAVEDLESLNSPITDFVEERCDLGPQHSVRIADIFQAWREWCEKNGRDNVGTAQSFGAKLTAAYPSIQKGREGVSDRKRLYVGISVKKTAVAYYH